MRLRKVRNHAGETQKTLAELLGVSPNQMGEMENGGGGNHLGTTCPAL
ncbi:helix-turn-helix domain-containing protein [Flavonifractor sp. DFI.6.63]|nr:MULTISPECIES: helix-turn-helix transcriptional regulator [Oscillospiraceae]MCI6397484.1 helix-turn-helix domain-containing protein [Lawsonibacter sp.]MCQ5028229.1 helix-turn-helix domain-containing protein [Flavonifractor sp. DFI.6.63]